MTKKLSKKQALKRRTIELMYEVSMLQLDESQRKPMTPQAVLDSYPERAVYHRHQRTGQIRLGLCYKGIRGLVKKYPRITEYDLCNLFGIIV